MPARRSTTTRASVKPSTPLPKGARIPQPALVIWIVRSLFIGALLLFLVSPRIPTTYLLVRATMPGFSVSSGRLAGSATPSGDELFRAIQRAVPAGSPQSRFRGRAPWVAFTLTGIPDQPVELGVVVADRDAR